MTIKRAVNIRERAIISSILIGILIMVVLDLLNDFQEGVKWWHLLYEGIIALAAIVGFFILIKGTFQLRHSLEQEKNESFHLKAEAENWRSQSRKYLEGLSLAINEQLINWGLTKSEKEVAFLLLKGLSLKEIADVRNTTEKTARTQSTSIYSKAGLAGRSELAAFFLEDLLLPNEISRV